MQSKEFVQFPTKIKRKAKEKENTQRSQFCKILIQKGFDQISFLNDIYYLVLQHFEISLPEFTINLKYIAPNIIKDPLLYVFALLRDKGFSSF